MFSCGLNTSHSPNLMVVSVSVGRSLVSKEMTLPLIFGEWEFLDLSSFCEFLSNRFSNPFVLVVLLRQVSLYWLLAQRYVCRFFLCFAIKICFQVSYFIFA